MGGGLKLGSYSLVVALSPRSAPKRPPNVTGEKRGLNGAFFLSFLTKLAAKIWIFFEPAQKSGKKSSNKNLIGQKFCKQNVAVILKYVYLCERIIPFNQLFFL